MGFHEDRMQASEEASLQVTHAGLPGGEQGTIVVVIVVALPETLMLQHTLRMSKQVALRLARSSMGHMTIQRRG